MPERKARPGSRTPKRASFDYSLDFTAIDFRQRPELYRVGKGEQGVLLVEPYKGEILPHWKFKTVADAKKSAAKIYNLFLAYLKADDFPGADMARKVLQMEWTRARRYANHTGGRKCDKTTGERLPRIKDAEKVATGGTSRSARTRSTYGRSSGTRGNDGAGGSAGECCSLSVIHARRIDR